jgi:signal transduction histidine kinase
MRAIAVGFRAVRGLASAGRRERAAVALAGLLLLGFAPPQNPVEQRLGDAWRWRLIDGPDGTASVFRLVRPGPDKGLLALDDLGPLIYDGLNWRRGPGWTAPTDEAVRDIAPLEDGLLVIGSLSVLTVDKTGSMKAIGPMLSPAMVSQACHHPDGHVDLAIKGHVERAGLKEMVPLLDPPVGVTSITALTHDASGAFWCATEKGIYRQVGNGWESVPCSVPKTEPATLYGLAATAGERMLFLPERLDQDHPALTWNGHELLGVRLDGSATVNDVTPIEGDAFVVATDSSDLLVLRDGVWHKVIVPLAAQDSVVSICTTQDGRLAIALQSGRLAVCEPASTQWESFDTHAAGAGVNVNALAPAAAGGVWVATDQGVLRWDGTRFVDLHLDADLQPLHDITSICEDADGDLWLGSGGAFKGAVRLHQGRWIREADKNGLGQGFVHAIRRYGDELWFALIGGRLEDWNEGGIVRWKKGVFTPWLTGAEGQHLTRAYDVLQRADGTLVAGLRESARMLDGSGWRNDPAGPFYNRTVFALHEAEDHTLWAGFGLRNPGVAVLHDGRWTSLISGTWRHAAAASFAETPDHRLWFASEAGLFLVSHDMSSHDVSQDTCHEVSGLAPMRKFWPVLSDGQGGLWLGTVGAGLQHFRPSDDDPPLVKGLTVSFGENGDVVATWSAVDFWNVTPPEDLSFDLELDGSRVSAGARDGLKAVFHALSPGKHRLELAALDNLGNKRGEPLRHVFDVPQPAWRSRPVLLTSSVIVLVLAWLLVVLRTRRRERALAQAAQHELTERLSQLTLRLLSSQEDERRNLSREMHDDLGQLLTAACLDIERAARLSDPERRTEALRTALRAARDTQQRVREISHMLRPTELDDHGLPQAVATVLSDFTLRSGIDVESRVDLDVEAVPADVANHVFRILQEALTNILRHAKAGTAYVSLRATGGRVELSVRDDGEGFDPASVPPTRRFGLLGMRERAELLGGKFSISSKPEGGTEVSVSIPLPHR